MIVPVVLLGVVAVVALVLALVTRSRLGTQRRLAAAAEERAAHQERELATTTASLEAAARERLAAEELARAAEARAAAADAAREQAWREAEQAAEAQRTAEERALAAEQRAADFATARAAAAGGVDPEVLWTLEQARSERTWRHSVAVGPDSVSVFADASDPLREALQVELDAAREEVGAIVELDADLPPGVTAAGSVLALRAAQELLAVAVRRGEVTTLHVHGDGADLIVAVSTVDEDGEPVSIEPLALPVSPDIAPTDDGVRIRAAVRPPGIDADDAPPAQ